MGNGGFDPVRLAAAGLALLALVAVVGGGLSLREPASPRVKPADAGPRPAGAKASTAAAAAAPAIDGKAVSDGLCFACHTSGVGNAPTLDRSHWNKRLAQGKEALYRHAIDGYTGPDGGMMPPKGGNPSLSDAEIRASVDWMLGNLK